MPSANTVAVLLIKIRADMKGLDKQFNSVKRSLGSLQNSFKSASSNMKKMSSGIKNAGNNMATSITRSTSSVKSSVQSMSSSITTSFFQSGKAIDGHRRKLTQLELAYRKVMTSPKRILRVATPPGTGDGTDAKAGGLKDTIDKHGRTAARSFGAVAVGLGALFYNVTKSFAEFEVSLKRAGEISGATAEQMKQLEDSANSLAMSTGIASQEIAEGMATMARMGFETEKILKAMPSILDATIVSGEKFDTVLNVVESTLAAYNMEAEETARVTDVLSKATNLSRAKFKSLGEVLKYSAPAAHDLGVSLEELTSAAAIMIQNGKQGGIAGRTLRAALQRLSAPTEAAQIELSKLNVKVKDAKGNMLPFSKILLDLNKGLQGYGNAQKVAALKTIFGMEASSGMLSVVNEAPDKFKSWTEALEDSGGATKKLADEVKKSLWYQLNILVETLKVAGRELGKVLAPSVEKLSKGVSKLAKWWINLDDSTKKAVGSMAQWVFEAASVLFVISSLGRALKYIFAPLKIVTKLVDELAISMGAKGASTTVLGFAKNLRVVLVGALRALLSPIGLVVAAIAGLALLISKTSDDLDELEERQKKYQDSVDEDNRRREKQQKHEDQDKGKPVSKTPFKPGMGPLAPEKIEDKLFPKKVPPVLTEYDKKLIKLKESWTKLKQEAHKFFKDSGLLKIWEDGVKRIGNAVDWVKQQFDKLSDTVKNMGPDFLQDLADSANSLLDKLNIIRGLKPVPGSLLAGGGRIYNPPYKEYTPPKIPGLQTPWKTMSYTNSPTYNVTTAKFDERSVKRYNAKEYWRKAGSVGL